MKSILGLCLFWMLSLAPLSAQSIDGTWEGALNVQGMKIRLVFHFNDTNSGYSAKMDSPDQGAFGIPVDEVQLKASKLKLSIKAIGMSYAAKVVNAESLWDDSIAGTFEQNGMKLPLVLRRSNIEHTAFSDKYQTPMPPFPYPTEEVSFQHDGVTLGGTLSLPKGVTSAPAVILISGSGKQNRDEEIMGHKPFLVIADYLTRNGFAVLRYDDRGYGASTGDFDTSTIVDFTEDARAALAYLKSRADIKSVGLIGHSEGSSVAAKLAANNKDVAFVISLAGPGLKGDSLLLMQARSMLLSLNMQKEMGAALAQNRGLFRIINLNKSPKETEQLMREFLNTIPSPQPQGPTSKEEYIDNIVKMVNEPGLVYFIRYNPADDFSKVHCPVLALNGEKDFQVDATVNIEAIAAALKIAGNKDVTTKIFPGKNHLFQACTTCTIQEYGQLKETFSEEVLETMLEWLKRR